MIRAKIAGYYVIEVCDDFEQVLGIYRDEHTPPGGILEWTDGPRALFPDRKTARAAINRTEHYRLAFGDTPQRPERKFCRIAAVRMEPAA